MIDKRVKFALILVAILVVVTVLTQFDSSTDAGDYAGVAKFFAGDYNADIRSSHSMLYGFIHAPLVNMTNSFAVMKLTSLLFLVLIILSVYHISGNNKKALLLMAASPIVWYLAPWLNPIQLAALLFLWSFFFINKFDKTGKLSYVIYSGILLGLAAAFWNTILYIALFMAVCFFFNRNINFLFVFILSFFIGLIPLFILEHYLFGFFLFSMSKTFASNIVVFLSGSIYPQRNILTPGIIDYLLYLLLIPLFSYTLFFSKTFSQNKRQIIFLSIILLFFLLNPQIRYLLLIFPILVVYLSKTLTRKQFRIQLVVFLVLSLLITVPYVIQINHSTNSPEFRTSVINMGSWEFTSIQQKDLISEDLRQITADFPNEVFVVGPANDDYSALALYYWGDNVKEFVSIEDYNFYVTNNSVIYEKRFSSNSRIQNRRQIWIEGGMGRNPSDDTNYEDISLGLGMGGPLEIDGFEVEKKYNILFLSRKSN